MRAGKRLVPGLVIAISMFLCMATALAIPSDSQSAAYSIRHNFGGTDDGFQPYHGGPALSGSTLYGMTQGGGGSGSYGVLYKINTDGTGYDILHHFASGTDGTSPRGGLTLSGSTLYGCTEYGGGSNGGTVFKINTDGGGYQVLKRFSTATDQCYPYGAPVVSGSMLYGMHSSSGFVNGLNGAIFSLNLEGGEYQLLHEFGGATTDGAIPYGSLTLVGSTLYGMTYYGGAHGTGPGYGVIFSLNLDTKEYKVLHDFAGAPSDGRFPLGALTLVGSKFYGMTYSGGADGNGVIFSMNLDGGEYQVVLNFGGATGSTGGPDGSLTQVGSKLYGLTSAGGPGGASGVIFRVNPDGTGFKILHGFMSSQGDGGQPMGDLTLAGSRFYGWTYGGGSQGGGVFFSYQLPQADTMMMQLLLLE